MLQIMLNFSLLKMASVVPGIQRNGQGGVRPFDSMR
jgi:hypothetical protein